MRLVMLIALCACVFLYPAVNATNAAADTIPGLFNTGVDDLGNGLAMHSYDPHYIMSGTGATGAKVTPVPGAWMSAPAGSKWIGPNPQDSTDGLASDPVGAFSYTLTFSLAGLDPQTASISGSVAADNSVRIFLNGANTGLSFAGFASLASFSLTQGFVSGLNFLDFRLTNDTGGSWGNPAGLLVSNLSGSAQSTPLQAQAVPVPPSLLLLGAGLVTVAGVRKRVAR